MLSPRRLLLRAAAVTTWAGDTGHYLISRPGRRWRVSSIHSKRLRPGRSSCLDSGPLLCHAPAPHRRTDSTHPQRFFGFTLGLQFALYGVHVERLDALEQCGDLSCGVVGLMEVKND